MLLAFSWTIILCSIGFQYLREKQYKSDFLNAQLQLYNKNLLKAVENGYSYEDYIARNEQPFDELRISIIALSGYVVYDNTLPSDSLDNHLITFCCRIEIFTTITYRLSTYMISRTIL